jgi:hypothetical protein
MTDAELGAEIRSLHCEGGPPECRAGRHIGGNGALGSAVQLSNRLQKWADWGGLMKFSNYFFISCCRVILTGVQKSRNRSRCSQGS